MWWEITRGPQCPLARAPYFLYPESYLQEPAPSVCSSTSTKAHLHLVDAGWGPDPSTGLGRGPTRLVAAAPAHSRGLSLGWQGWPRRPPGSWPAPAQAVPALTVSPVAHEAVSPHELLGADATLIGFETCVCLHVLGQVVLHLKLFVAHRAVKGPQVEVHIHMPIAHALVGEGLPTVAQKDLIPIPTACPSRGPPRTTRHAQGPCRGAPQGHRPVFSLVPWWLAWSL